MVWCDPNSISTVISAPTGGSASYAGVPANTISTPFAIPSGPKSLTQSPQQIPSRFGLVDNWDGIDIRVMKLVANLNIFSFTLPRRLSQANLERLNKGAGKSSGTGVCSSGAI